MKKAFYIFILVVLFNLVTVDAKTIITTKGSDKSEAITYNNDQISPSIYNWDNERDVITNYYDSKEGKIIPSIVSINAEESLRNGKVYTSLVNNKDDGKDYQISKTLAIDNNVYLLFGAVKINNNFVPVINYYEGNVLIWQYLYSPIGRGRFVGGVIDGNVVHCLGEYEQEDSFTTDILVIELSLTGVLNQMKLIKGNKDATAHEIYKSHYGLFFVTETASYTLDYNGFDQYGSGVILSRLTTDYTDLKMFCVKNFLGAEYFSSMMVDDTLIVYLAVKGMGEFPYNTPDGYTEAFATLDKYVEDVGFNKLSQNHYVKQAVLFSDDKSYFLAGYNDLKKEIVVFQYTKEFRYSNIIPFTIISKEENLLKIDNIKLDSNHILLLNTINIFSGHEKFYYFSLNKQILKKDLIPFTFNEEGFKNVTYCDNYLYITLSRKINEREALCLYKVALVKLHDRFYLKEQKEYTSTFMTINYQEISGTNVFFEDISTLKTHNYYYLQDDGNLMCINEAKVKMLPSTNIEDGVIYDIGKKIIFNGQGYLNNKPISSGYVINESGFYILKQESEEKDIYITEFNIRELKTLLPDEKIVFERKKPKIIINENKPEEEIIIKTNGEISNISFKNDYRIYLFAIVVLFSISFAFLLPSKYLRRIKK